MEHVMAKKINPKNKPWFPFYTAAWLGSGTVINMSMGERGIYITLMALCWQHGDLPWDEKTLARLLVIDKRTVRAFMDKYVSLVEDSGDSPESPGEEPRIPGIPRNVVLPKLHDFAMTLAKNASDDNTEERREDKKEKREEQKPSVPIVSVTEKKNTPVPVKDEIPVPVKNGFDPLTYSEPVTSTKGDALEYPSEDVHRILLYHLKYHPSDFWTGKVSSSADVARHITTMHDQMVKDAGEDWTPPEAKKPLTRMVGDPACLKCRGRGKVGVLQKDGLTRVTTDCTCEKHQQVAKGREWVNV
jgi:hypothetical protein